MLKYHGHPTQDLVWCLITIEQTRADCGWDSKGVPLCSHLIDLLADIALQVVQLAQARTFENAKAALFAHFLPPSPERHFLDMFNSLRMQTKERVVEFHFRFAAAHAKAEYLHAGQVSAEQELYTFIHGLRPQIVGPVLLANPRTVMEAVQAAKIAEEAAPFLTRMTDHSESQGRPQHLHQKFQKHTTRRTQHEDQPSLHAKSSSLHRCAHCKRTNHTSDKCYVKFPHLRPKRNVNAIETSDNENLVIIPLNVGNHTLKALVDCGAQLSLVRRSALPPNADIKSTNHTIKLADASTKTMTGRVTLSFELPTFMNKVRFTSTLIVCEELSYDAIIAMDFLQSHCVLINPMTKELTPTCQTLAPTTKAQNNEQGEQSDTLALPNQNAKAKTKAVEGTSEWKSIAEEFPNVFQEATGHTDLVSHTIKLRSNEPTYQAPYRIPVNLRTKVKEEIAKLEAEGIIQKSTSEYAAPAFSIPKRDGSIRLVVDYRKLNAETVVERFPLPRIDDILTSLHGATVFSQIDLRNGYHQVPVKPEDVHKTAFVLPFGHYEYLRMPFGLVSTR